MKFTLGTGRCCGGRIPAFSSLCHRSHKPHLPEKVATLAVIEKAWEEKVSTSNLDCPGEVTAVHHPYEHMGIC